MNQPVKCPDCATWWRGDEHRCNATPHVCPPPYWLPQVPVPQTWPPTTHPNTTPKWPNDTTITVYS